MRHRFENLVAKIDENGVRSSSGTTLGYPLHPWMVLVTTSAGSAHEKVTFWEAFWGRILTLFGIIFLLFFSAFLNCSFGAFATTRVLKIAKKGAKIEPKVLPERLCDMCQKHGIYRTGSTSDPPGSVLKPDNSSSSC